MASIDQRSKTAPYFVRFRWEGIHYQKSIKTTLEAQALRLLAQVETTLADLERGRLTIPDDCEDIGLFIVSDGKQTSRPKSKPKASPQVLSVHSLMDRYFAELPVGSQEKNSLATLHYHEKHLKKHLPDIPISQFSKADLQAYIGKRSKEKWRGWYISPTTIGKEIKSLRAIWNTYSDQTGVWLGKGLKYPKGDEQPPFQTWEQIEERIKQDGLDEKQAKKFWATLFLSAEQAGEFLDNVEAHCEKWFHAMLTMAYHTGARRSELCRAMVGDVDFRDNEIIVRERKRDKSAKGTYRHIPLSQVARETGLTMANIKNNLPLEYRWIRAHRL